MLIYWEVFLITFIIQYIPTTKINYRHKIILSFVPLFLFGALKVGGNDYYVYEDGYYEIKNLIDLSQANEHFEIGYVYLNKIMPSWRSLISLTSLCMCMAYGRLFYKFVPPNQTKLAFLLLFLSGNYTIYFVLSTIRNGLAVSLLILSFTYIVERKWFPTLILAIIATSIHTSAMAAFPIAYFVARNGRMSRMEFYIWLIVAVLLIFMSSLGILEFIEPYINRYMDRYDSVIRELNNVSATKSYLTIIGGVGMAWGLFYYILNSDLSKMENSLFRLSLLFPYSYFLGILNTRVTQYYIFFYIIAISIIALKSKKQIESKFLILLSIFFIGYAFILWTQGTWFAHMEYHSILEDL